MHTINVWVNRFSLLSLYKSQYNTWLIKYFHYFHKILFIKISKKYEFWTFGKDEFYITIALTQGWSNIDK